MKQELQRIAKEVGDLPAMPVVAVQIIKMFQDPNNSAKQLADVIAKDQAVSARILKIANSSFYSMRGQIKTLEHAIVILGENTLKSLVLATSLQGINRSFGLLEKMFFEDSMGAALAARLTAVRLKSADPEESFLAGLLRNIGKMIMNNVYGERYQTLVAEVYNNQLSYVELEKEHFSFTHAELGAAVLENWNLSPRMINVVRHHNQIGALNEVSHEALCLGATVNIADALCRRLGIGQRKAAPFADIEKSDGALILNADTDQLLTIMDEFKENFEKDREAFLD